MGLATISQPPQTAEEVAAWSMSHQASHVDFQRVIFAQRGTQIPLYALDPFRPTMDWLYQNQVQHTAIAFALNFKGYNLTTVDWQDEDSVAEWMALHGQEHQIASQILGLA